jgi:hypothetical protein
MVHLAGMRTSAATVSASAISMACAGIMTVPVRESGPDHEIL